MNHLYTGVHLGMSHRALGETLDRDGNRLGQGDTAIFINNAWTAAKIMTRRNTYIYVRGSTPFSIDELIRFPTYAGGKPLKLAPEQYKKLVALQEKTLGKPRRQVPKAA